MALVTEWYAVNPKARVPALSDVPGRIGERANVLTEAPAILFYLARLHPSTGLLPSEPAGEARCLEWMNFLSIAAGTEPELWPVSHPSGARRTLWLGL